MTEVSIASKTVASPSANNYRLLLISITALFAEVMLIRWIGTEIRIFAFFQNLALIACFLGFGLGCYRANERTTLLPSLKAVTGLVVMATLPIPFYRTVLVSISDLLGMSPDAALWGMGNNVFGTEQLAAFFLAGAVVSFFIILLMMSMMELGRWVAFYMDSAPNLLQAYSLNLLGSVAGVWLMAIVSFRQFPPIVWFCLLFVLAILCTPVSRRVLIQSGALLVAVIVCLHFANHAMLTTWSPYQKIEVYSGGDENYEIQVNNSTYMTIANRTQSFLDSHPAYAKAYRVNSYDSPFLFAESKKRILIVGSGAGNDVAAALRSGAERVDAVEIDPAIRSIGQSLHPEHPYDSPRVHLYINDARNFLRESHNRYDVIVFGLLDSHTGFSSYSNMRVDNYVYTDESFASARQLLSPNGILVLKFEIRHPWEWMGQRFFTMLNKQFGRPPIGYYGPGSGVLPPATVFIESNSSSLWERARQPDLLSLVVEHPLLFTVSSENPPPATTDDWPFIYHKGRTIPRTYLTVTVILFFLAFTSVRHVFKPKELVSWHFVFMGAGFLLLETQLINRLALYFGSTWFVNCIALTAMLCVLVISNLFIEAACPKKLTMYYLMLLASIILIYMVQWGNLTYSSRTVGILLSLAFSVTVFLAGVVFAQSFRRARSKSQALGANVFGAVMGGLLQNLSFLLGMRMLLLVTAIIYCGAWICDFYASSKSDFEPETALHAVSTVTAK